MRWIWYWSFFWRWILRTFVLVKEGRLLPYRLFAVWRLVNLKLNRLWKILPIWMILNPLLIRFISRYAKMTCLEIYSMAWSIINGMFTWKRWCVSGKLYCLRSGPILVSHFLHISTCHWQRNILKDGYFFLKKRLMNCLRVIWQTRQSWEQGRLQAFSVLNCVLQNICPVNLKGDSTSACYTDCEL